jgi:hypothetical protein
VEHSTHSTPWHAHNNAQKMPIKLIILLAIIITIKTL